MIKTLLTVFFALFLVAGCSKPEPGILNDISGVWRTSDNNSLVTMNYKDSALQLAMGDMVIPVKIGAIDTDNKSINLNVVLSSTGKTATWTIKQVWDQNKKTFYLVFTTHSGEQAHLEFVRKVSADDLSVFGAKNLEKSGLPVIQSASSVSQPQETTSSMPAQLSTPDQNMKLAKKDSSEISIMGSIHTGTDGQGSLDNDSNNKSYSFEVNSDIGEKILSACPSGGSCEIQAVIDGENNILSIRSAKKVAL